ncbi:VOC family protein, partial [Clavibacter phaseoli]
DLPAGSLADLAAGPRDGYALRVRAADGTPVDF